MLLDPLLDWVLLAALLLCGFSELDLAEDLAELLLECFGFAEAFLAVELTAILSLV